LDVYESPEELAAALADVFVDEAKTAVAARGGFYVALSGGTTPRAAYALLAKEPRRNAISWKDVFIYFGDERCVPPDDERSNYRMARTAFLDGVNLPPKNVHRMLGEAPPPEAAAAYAKILREDLGSSLRFDLVLLGVGPDGHTASLFPGSLPDETHTAGVAAVYVAALEMYRLTLTPQTINAARRVAIVAEGAHKASILREALEERPVPELPVQRIAPERGRLTWMIDRAAASQLSR